MSDALEQSLSALRVNFHARLARRAGRAVSPNRRLSQVPSYDDNSALERSAAHRLGLNRKLAAAIGLAVVGTLAIVWLAVR